MSAVPGDPRGQHAGEAMRAAEYSKRDPRRRQREEASRSSGAAQIASVVLPFLERVKGELSNTVLRLDLGVRKFDISTGENWSVYFRVVNTQSQKASHYYIINLSSRYPLIIMADSLDVGSAVRRREVWDQTIQSHDDITEQVLSKLLDRGLEEAGPR